MSSVLFDKDIIRHDRIIPGVMWTGEDANGFPCVVLLWRMPPEDLHGPLFPNPENG